MEVMTPAPTAASGTASPYFRALFLEGEMSRLIRYGRVVHCQNRVNLISNFISNFIFYLI
jgi:hypothetical protein